jgi:outer membrane receptor for ferrienterochelin and colicins
MRSSLITKRITSVVCNSVLLFCMGFCFAVMGHAAEKTDQSADLLGLQLEDLLNVNVSGASKFEQPVSEAPASISIVTAETIKLFGYRNLAEILRAQRGMFVSDDRNYSYAGVRGFGRTGDFNTRLLVLVDGHRINDNTYDSVYIGNDFIIDVDLIDRVEIIRGPASSLYGNNAFFGVVNVITRHGKGLKGVELATEAGSLHTYKGRISYGNSFNNDLALTMSGSYLDSHGRRNLYYPQYNDPATNNGVAHNLDGERSGNIFATASWRDLTLQGAYVSRRKDVPTASFDSVFNQAPNFTNDTRAYANLKYEHAFPSDWWLLARLYYDHYAYYGEAPYTNPALYLNRDEAFNNSVGTEFQLSTLLSGGHRVMAGMTLLQNSTTFTNYDIDPFAANLDLTKKSVSWSGFLQDEYTIMPNLILSAGVRYDHYQSFGGEISPRAALIYSPFKQSAFKLIYGEAFRAPNNYELYYTASILGLSGNPDLKPEKIQTYELIYEQQLLSYYKLTLSGFHNNISQMIRSAPDDTDPTITTFQNLNRATVWGGEGELEAKWPGGYGGRVSYSYQEAVDQMTGQRLVNSPHHMIKGNMVLPLIEEKLFSGVEMQYMSGRKTLAGEKTKDHLITNLTLFSKKWIKGLECSFSVYNLFDQRYSDPGSEDHIQDTIQQNGISWRFKAVYTF